MPAYIDQSLEQFLNQVHVGNLPTGVNAKRIVTFFDSFGIIIKLYLKRRVSKESSIPLPNPSVILIFEKRQSVDEIMKKRPFIMDDCQLFIRRCIPVTRRYPYEAYHTVNKILIRTPLKKHDEILPNDNIIADYLKSAGGKILRLERFEEKTILVEFDDYDPVDVCCLSRPHFIYNQLIEIEKCCDEQQARRRAQFRLKSRSVSLKPSSSSSSSRSTTADIDAQSIKTISPTPTLNIDEQFIRLRSTYNDVTSRLEDEHEQLLASLRAEWEKTAKERIRLQRLTLDYQQERERLTEENRQWKKLYSDSLQEKPQVQNGGERVLLEATEKYSNAKAYYDQIDLDNQNNIKEY